MITLVLQVYAFIYWYVKIWALFSTKPTEAKETKFGERCRDHGPYHPAAATLACNGARLFSEQVITRHRNLEVTFSRVAVVYSVLPHNDLANMVGFAMMMIWNLTVCRSSFVTLTACPSTANDNQEVHTQKYDCIWQGIRRNILSHNVNDSQKIILYHWQKNAIPDFRRIGI